MTDIACISCRFFDMDTVSPDDSRIPAQQTKRKGCRRFPQVVWKRFDEWCGEYVPMSDSAPSSAIGTTK